MIKEFIGTGKTVEEATSAAKAGLGAPDSADVKVEIVEMPKKGFLGLGSKPAQVKVSYDDGVKESAPKKQRLKSNSLNKSRLKRLLLKRKLKSLQSKKSKSLKRKEIIPKALTLSMQKAISARL